MAGAGLGSMQSMMEEYIKMAYASAIPKDIERPSGRGQQIEECTVRPPFRPLDSWNAQYQQIPVTPPSTWDVHQLPAASRSAPGWSAYGAHHSQCDACGSVFKNTNNHACSNPTGTFLADARRAAFEKHLAEIRARREQELYEKELEHRVAQAKAELALMRPADMPYEVRIPFYGQLQAPIKTFEVAPPPKVLKCPHMVELVPKTPVSDFENTRAKILAAARREVAVSYREWPTCKTTGNPWEFKVGGDYVGREGWYNVSFGCMGCNVHED